MEGQLTHNTPMTLGDAIVFTSRRLETLETRFSKLNLENEVERKANLATLADDQKALHTQVEELVKTLGKLRVDFDKYVSENGHVTLDISAEN